MKQRQRRGRPSPMSKKKYRTSLKPKTPTVEDQWKALVNDFQELKMQHNKGTRGRFHHQNGTEISRQRMECQYEPKQSLRLNNQFFYPRNCKDNVKCPSSKTDEFEPKTDEIAKHLVQLFQRKSGMKLFYMFDKERKGYLSQKDVDQVTKDIGYRTLNQQKHATVYNKLVNLCSNDAQNITYKGLHNINVNKLATNRLGEKSKRQNHELTLYQQYLNPVSPRKKRAKMSKLFYCKSDKEKASRVIQQLQDRYNNLYKPLTKLKVWDVDKDGQIDKGELKGMMENKMNIYLDEGEFNEFFSFFKRNEAKSKKLKRKSEVDCISYPIFLQTIMQHDFDEESNERDVKLLTPPQKKPRATIVGDLDKESMRILGRLRDRAEGKFGSKQLTTDVFRFLDMNKNTMINHDEFRQKLKHIDSDITTKEADKVIELMDPENEGKVHYGQFAQCFNRPVRKKMKPFSCFMEPPKASVYDSPLRGSAHIFDIDPKSTHYASTKEQYKRGPFVAKATEKIMSPSKKNKSVMGYNILHHT